MAFDPKTTSGEEEARRAPTAMPVVVTGGYAAVWALDVALCVFASAMSMRIGRVARA